MMYRLVRSAFNKNTYACVGECARACRLSTEAFLPGGGGGGGGERMLAPLHARRRVHEPTM
eukprot:3034532-Pleurochrysis_carterae.AAC.1